MKHHFIRRSAGLVLALVLLLSGCQLIELPGTPDCHAVASIPEPGTAVLEIPEGVGTNLDQAPVKVPEPPVEPDPEPEIEAEPEPEPEPEPQLPEETPLFPEDLRIVAGQAFAYDLDEGRMVAMKGEGEQLYPASTTKLLTILLALRYLELDRQITPGDELSLVSENSSMAYIDRYDTVTVEQLIEGMLLPSGNDAACTLAAATGRAITGEWTMPGLEAVQVCVDAMNNYAAELGMTGSHFTNVDGYRNSEHYTTVEDMAIVATLAAQNEIIRKYCGLTMDTVTYVSGEVITWYNSNLMLFQSSQWYNPHVTGMKTGSLLGHYSLVCTVEKDGKTYVTGIFSAPSTEDRYYDMNTVVNWLLSREGDPS